jgi:hypothetical protein
MKRIVLLLVGTLLVAWSASAQLLSFGARVGIGTGNYNFNSLSIAGGTLEPAGNRVSGYQAALFMRLSIPKFVYIQPEVQLAQRDYVLGFKSPSQPKEFKTVRTYRVDIPLLVGIKMGNVRLFGGPVWRIDSQQQIEGGGSTPFNIFFNDNDIAAVGGVGVEFDGVVIEVRYSGYLKQTKAEMKVASERRQVDITEDNTIQVNFGLFF